MMDTSEKLCLQWNDFKESITSSFKELREDRDFTDVTLACEDGRQIKAHKIVLASSSPFFMDLLKKNKHSHPLLYMRGLKSEDLVAIVDFLYHGEANVFQENLDSFLALAEELRLEGLTGVGEAEKEPAKYVPHSNEIPPKKENSPMILPNSNFESLPSKESFDTPDVLAYKAGEDLLDLDAQIRSMFTRSDISAGNGQGKMALCNVCGKEKYFKHMLQHIEANHITGVSHACDLCGKVSRSRNALSKHKCQDSWLITNDCYRTRAAVSVHKSMKHKLI